MILLTQMNNLMQSWDTVFPQKRTLHRAMEHAIASSCSLGRRTISRTICVLDRHQQDWSADYKIFSRSNWNAEELFTTVIEQYRQRFPHGPIAIGFDDTKLPRSSKKIKTAFRQRDPMSPPFHTNLILAQRFIQGAMLFPHHQHGDYAARGVPVCFREAPVVKKPSRKASAEEQNVYKKSRREYNLSTQTRNVIKDMRYRLDNNECQQRQMFAVLDGSFCNQTIFKTPFERTHLIARCRKDAKLCYPAVAGGRRKFDTKKFTPEQIRKDPRFEYIVAPVFFGGRRRDIKYKEITNILWQRGSGTKRLRLIVIAPQPYKTSPNAKKVNYRQPAYVLTTDTTTPTAMILQAYFDRWEIEVNHRDEKSILGVGQAQVHSEKATSRHPVFRVAVYSIMLLAAMNALGERRTDHYIELPKWRKKATRPSALDMICLLRKQMNEMQFSNNIAKTYAKNAENYAYT